MGKKMNPVVSWAIGVSFFICVSYIIRYGFTGAKIIFIGMILGLIISIPLIILEKKGYFKKRNKLKS
ncbi:MAG TPA: hypothetical protein VJH95_00175 [Candidatus Nanoarchaeia archaeon]|nr:hypothetical protein [Candidatus Nanoarchaeia archaeon]